MDNAFDSAQNAITSLSLPGPGDHLNSMIPDENKRLREKVIRYFSRRISEDASITKLGTLCTILGTHFDGERVIALRDAKTEAAINPLQGLISFPISTKAIAGLVKYPLSAIGHVFSITCRYVSGQGWLTTGKELGRTVGDYFVPR